MGARQIIMLGTALETKGGISAVVSAYRAGGLFERWPIRYIATHREARALSKFVLAATSFMRFVGLILTGRVAALHVHSASRGSFWRKSPFLLLAFISARPVVFHLHGGGFRAFFEQECGPLARAWVRTVFRRAARVIVLSQHWESWVRSVEGQANLLVIPNPAPPGKIRPERFADDPTLLFLGSIAEKKGVFDLLEAVADLRARYPRLRLVLAGVGEAQARVKERARALGISEQVELPGWIDASARDAWLAKADVFVLPSYYEGLPMSVLEAMAAGLPVIASDVGGIPEVIQDGVDGLLVAPGAVPALVRAIAKLLAQPALRESMGKAAQRKVARHYASERVMERIDAVYREIIGIAPTGLTAKIKQHA